MTNLTLPRLGMGCWPIGGPFFAGDTPLGFAGVDDAQSLRTLHAAYAAGIRLYDTAAVYGAGHSERLIARAFANTNDIQIVTKIGMGFDEVTKQLTGDEVAPAQVLPAIERCLTRLNRDTIDLLLLHQNSLPVDQARPLFEQMEIARDQGKIRAYGWSTDFPDSVRAMADMPGFAAVEHAMNLFFDAPSMQHAVAETSTHALIRSPLAMGVLTGKYDAQSRMPADDIRSTHQAWRDYFDDTRVAPGYLDTLDKIRDCLTIGGRTLPQGALCWLLAKSPHTIPIPGARTPDHITETAAALSLGPLPETIMDEIETLLDRPPEGPPRER